MLRRERDAVVRDGEHRVIVGADVGQRDVGGVAAVAVEHHRVGFGQHLELVEEAAEQHALPSVVVARPVGDAVDVVVRFSRAERGELLVVEDQFGVDRAPDLEIPVLGLDQRGAAVGEHGPLAHEALAGR